jgi:hypothetical protein
VGDQIPRLVYTDTEKEVWKFCYDQLSVLFEKNACSEFVWTIREFEKNIGFRSDQVP